MLCSRLIGIYAYLKISPPLATAAAQELKNTKTCCIMNRSAGVKSFWLRLIFAKIPCYNSWKSFEDSALNFQAIK